MKTIYYTVTKESTGLYLDERGAVQNIYAANTPTAQPPTPVYGQAEIEKRLAEMRPDDRFQRIFLDTPDFWRKVSEIRPQPTHNDLALLGRGSAYAEEPFSLDDFYYFD